MPRYIVPSAVVVQVNGGTALLRPGTIVDGDDPAYLANPGAFLRLADDVEPGDVEMARANPGERRGRR